VASCNVADARLITIKPWERTLIPEIEKAIRAAQLGLNPQSDGEIVRLPMPALTQERRQELVKVVKKMSEDARVALRGARRDANEMLKDALKEGAITEDDERKGLKTVQDTTDKAIGKIDEGTSTAAVKLEQTPLAEAALIAIDNHTGQIKAMVGGWNFSRSKFNRSIQAYRQLGSTFKPIVYTAAIDRGYTASSMIDDVQLTYPQPVGPAYSPANYDHQFLGPITLRYALEESRNIPAIKLMEAVGPPAVLEYAKRFGFDEPFPPYLPIALGAGDATLLEITSAYTTFPNQGVRMKPFFVMNVKDREGNLLEENRSEPTDVIRADTAFVMTHILRGVLSPRGTGARAAALASTWPLAGKTGTVDDNTDAWFIGFDPDLTVGVWIGFDDKRKSLGTAEQGSLAALPMWMEFMQGYINGRPDKDDPPEFEAPGNIVFLPIDQKTGTVVSPGSAGAVTEAFIAGTQPGGIGQ